jgi:putative MATE family efflux protein
MDQDNNLTTQPISTLMARIAIPSSVGFFFNTMYNVVDTYFAGLISTEALAAISISFPIFFIIMAVGNGMATGTVALIGGALGGGRRKEAEILGAQGLSFGLLVSLALLVGGWWAAPYLFRFLGAEGQYLEIGVAYMTIIFQGSAFFLTVFMTNAILNSMGDTRTYRNFLIVAFLLNVGLDPWFIYGGFGLPAMGFKGVALATVLVQVVGCFYIGYKVRKSGFFSTGFLRRLLPRPSVYKEIAQQGFPASINIATIGIGIFVIQYFVSRFGHAGVAAYGVAMRVEQIALLPTIGLNIAVLTLSAQNYGAGLPERVMETVNKALKYGAMILGVGAVLVIAFSRPLMAFFSDDPEVVAIGATYLKIDALVFYAYIVLGVHVAALQGSKKPLFAVWVGVYRQILAPLVIYHVLSQTLGFGLLGVWWGIFLVTWSAALIGVFYGRRLLKRRLGLA